MTTSITRILITDDEPLALKATAHLLKSAGYEVLTASNGEETLQLAEQDHPDIMLLDVILPDIEGTEICRRLKADPHTADIFIILLSGIRIASDEQSEAMEGGADGYIVRPIAGRELLARIQAYMRVKNAEQRIKEYSRYLEEVIAERKKGEVALRESEEKYHQLFENSFDAVMITKIGGSVDAANPAACQMFGLTEMEIKQVGWGSLIDRSDPNLVEALQVRALKGKFKGELTGIHKDGSKFQVEITFSTYTDKHGIIRMNMVIRDISIRTQA